MADYVYYYGSLKYTFELFIDSCTKNIIYLKFMGKTYIYYLKDNKISKYKLNILLVS